MVECAEVPSGVDGSEISLAWMANGGTSGTSSSVRSMIRSWRYNMQHVVLWFQAVVATL